MSEVHPVTYYLYWLATLFVGLLTFLLVRHYMKIRSLPPGPFPLPLIGNLLSLRGKNVVVQNVLMEFGKKYNGIYTFWMGPTPAVIVTSWDLCREALITRKHDFNGKVSRSIVDELMDGAQDVLTTEGHVWEVLRKVFVSAVRKYAASEKLANLVSDMVDLSVEIKLKEGKPVDARNFAYLMIYNVLASSAFGQRFEEDDPEFLAFRKHNEDSLENFQKILLPEVLPVLAPFFRKARQEFLAEERSFKSMVDKKYDEHMGTYQKGVIRDFTDAMLFAKEEAEEEGKDSQEFLIDKNLKYVLLDFFSAGTLSTKIFLLWTLLIICNKTEVQRKIQAEIDENIGSRPPKQEDKRICPYTQAVIIESLRFRPVVDVTPEHRTVCDTEIGGHKIPKDTTCMFHILNVQRDEKLWEDPNEFKPERFLDQNGQLNRNRPESYMPFGLGPRQCAGEKLVQADMFLILVRLLQKVELQLENGPGSVDLEPEIKNLFSLPKMFNMLLKQRQLS